jgi:hypothetical protein
MNIREAAFSALQSLGEPAHVSKIYSYIIDHGLYQFGAKDQKTALEALSVQIGRATKGAGAKRTVAPTFYKAAPATFGLLEWVDPKTADSIELDTRTEEELHEFDTDYFLELELHRWLFKILEKDGLTQLGYGKLELFDATVQSQTDGKFFVSGLGEMDMLLVTQSNDFVVIEIKREARDQAVGQICRYWGWVKENLCTNDQDVYGLILAQQIDAKKVEYALKAVTNAITIKRLEIDARILPGLP